MPVRSSPSHLASSSVRGVDAAQQGKAPSRNDPFRNRRLGGADGVVESLLLGLHLRLRRRSDADHGHPTGELGEALLQFLLVVVAGRFLDLAPDLLDAGLDLRTLPGAADDRRAFLVDHDPFRAPEFGEVDRFELEPELLGDDLAGCQDGDIAQHRLAPVAEARRLDGATLQGAAELIHDQRCQSFSLDVLGDHQDRPRGLRHLLQQRDQILEEGDLAIANEDDGIFQHRLHLLRIGDEIGRYETPVELHAFDDLEHGLRCLRFLDRDHPLPAHLFHGFGDELPDFLARCARRWSPPAPSPSVS